MTIRSDEQKQYWYALVDFILDNGFSNAELCRLRENTRLAAFRQAWPELSGSKRRRHMRIFGRHLGELR